MYKSHEKVIVYIFIYNIRKKNIEISICFILLFFFFLWRSLKRFLMSQKLWEYKSWTELRNVLSSGYTTHNTCDAHVSAFVKDKRVRIAHRRASRGIGARARANLTWKCFLKFSREKFCKITHTHTQTIYRRSHSEKVDPRVAGEQCHYGFYYMSHCKCTYILVVVGGRDFHLRLSHKWGKQKRCISV